MKLALLVYLAGISDSLSKTMGLLSLLIFTSIVIVALFLLINSCDGDGFLAIKKFRKYGELTEDEIESHNKRALKSRKSVKRYTIFFVSISFFLALFASLIPSERTIYIMAGAYATEQIATNDRVQKIGSDVLEVIEGKLSKMKQEDK